MRPTTSTMARRSVYTCLLVCFTITAIVNLPFSRSSESSLELGKPFAQPPRRSIRPGQRVNGKQNMPLHRRNSGIGRRSSPSRIFATGRAGAMESAIPRQEQLVGQEDTTSIYSNKPEVEDKSNLLLRLCDVGNLLSSQASAQNVGKDLQELEDLLRTTFEAAEREFGRESLETQGLDVSSFLFPASPDAKSLFNRFQELQRASRKAYMARLPLDEGVDNTSLKVSWVTEEIGGKHSIRIEGRAQPVLEISDPSIYTEVMGPDHLILGVQRELQNQMRVDLGPLNAERWMALARQKLWWMVPSVGSGCSKVKLPNQSNKMDPIPQETQFLLGKVDENSYVLLLPLVDQVFRTSLYSDPRRNNHLQLRLENGDPTLPSFDRVPNSLFVAAGTDPFELTKRAFGYLSKYKGTFNIRSAKPVPGSADVFGWCTWDAFYSSVNPEGVLSGLERFKESGIPVKSMILDDGWQATKNDELAKEEAGVEKVEDVRKERGAEELEGGGVVSADEYVETESLPTRVLAWFYQTYVNPSTINSWPVRLWRWLSNTILRSQLMSYFAEATDWAKRLSSLRANQKFDSLDRFVSRVKDEEGVKYVYCWHALLGYWLGVDVTSKSMKEFNPSIQYPCIQPLAKDGYDANILNVEPSLAWTPSTFIGVGMVETAKAAAFYTDLHSYLKSSRVDGVKVDAQSVLSVLGTGKGGGSAVTRHFVHSMEKSVHANLGNNLISCMAHASDNIFSFLHSPVARASDDYYPKDDRSHTQHVTTCAFNSIFLGEIVTPDWDCFHSRHPFAEMHAIARAVGGCPVYVSDRVDEINPDVLQKLVLPDGTVYRAQLPGRPTRDSMFEDIQTDGVSALKIWNRNDVNGVLGVFNVQGYGWSQDQHDYANFFPQGAPQVEAKLKASDIEGFVGPQSGQSSDLFALYSFQEQKASLVGPHDSITRNLPANASDVYIVAPFISLGAQRFAPLGCVDMYNGGGAVTKVEVVSHEDKVNDHSRVNSKTGNENAAAVHVRGVGRFLMVSSVPLSKVTLTAEVEGSQASELQFRTFETGYQDSSIEKQYTITEVILPHSNDPSEDQIPVRKLHVSF